ncbi:mitochondrial import inner membrane translocase subunit TIM44 [Ceratobasidium sp. AG-Ba]|nr:mitochondrial import inner membrane translocase subunit TIM44 [Ceratobasidium sp. AG-Ba]
MTDQEKLDMLDTMNRTEAPKNIDLKGQRLDLFDIRFPTPITSTSAGFKPKIDWVRGLISDRFQSIIGLRRIFKEGFLPPPKPSIFSLLTLSSPALSNTALSLYSSMNQALSRGDVRALEKACSEEQYDKLRAQIRSRPKGQTIEWKMDEKNSKATVLSMRCLDVWGTNRPEDFVAQVLVSFDTKQSIAVYGPGGKLISGDPNKVVRVREHLLLEKKGWESFSDWTIRKQMHRSS